MTYKHIILTKNGVAKMNVAKAAAIFIILIMVLSGVATFITYVM